ncbi:poly-gamma-glutamate biosynthesis protein [Limnohabitans curvus]|uniref:Poly-gamma-glutamate biosynthesis protein n=1 Tax=Limnohabitans curvus TaxID=323423 RepID=A0A315EM77_9BURK|nr:CapA family protein [Limnohabitans curvus]PUE58351.1 poly-gamma-glutamate biosynthesis protein [Limnohabitans curvus]
MKYPLQFLSAWCLSWFVVTVSAQTSSVEPVVSVVFAGDIMLEGGADRAIRRGRDPFVGVAHLFKNADLRLGNLECVVATVGSVEPEKPNTFRVHPRGLTYLRRHFDAVGLANNHSGDFGPKALTQMLGLLKQSGLGYYGGGHNLQEAHTPLVMERHGIRIAFLGYNEFQPRNFEADHDRAGIAWSEDEQVVRDIAQARHVWKADVVIPVMHWGWEESVANARQRELARLMIDAGADAVIGGHPHRVQDTEQYKGKPIFYSLGNFVFDGFPDKVNNIGWVVRLEIDRRGVRDWKTHEVRIDRQGLPHARK